MKIAILIIWHIFLNSGNAINEGSIQTAEFNSLATCEAALAQIKEESKYISGVCTVK